MSHEERAGVTDRRHWMESLIRYAAVGGVSAITLCLGARSWTLDCSRWTSACRTCKLLSRCELPDGRATRGLSTDKEPDDARR